MQKKKKKSLNDKIEDIVSNNTIWVFLGFILVVIILPRFLLEKSFLGYVPNDPKIDPSSIINNLTTPIIGLFSAFLVYIAFRAQIKANEELQKFNKKQGSFNDLNEVKILEDILNEELNKIEFKKDEKITLKGNEAIMNFVGFLFIGDEYKIPLFPYTMEFYDFNMRIEKLKYYFKLLTFYLNRLNDLDIPVHIKEFLLSKFHMNHFNIELHTYIKDILINPKNEYLLKDYRIQSLIDICKEAENKFKEISKKS